MVPVRGRVVYRKRAEARLAEAAAAKGEEKVVN
jgi:hypothetical protein